MTSPQLTYAQEMAWAHKPFVRELRVLPTVIRAVAAGDTARAGAVGGWAWMMVDELRLHHAREDELLWPLLIERLADDDQRLAVVTRMQGQHGVVEELVPQALDVARRWQETAAARDRDGVADLLDELREPLFVHLDDEVSALCPIAQDVVTATEWNRLSERARRDSPRDRAAVGLGLLLDCSSPVERAFLLSRLPVFVRPILAVMVERPYRRRMREVYGDRDVAGGGAIP